jgi:hypothetical protein
MAENVGGAPTKYQKDFHPQNFIELSNKGKCLAQIARAWNVHRDTIYEWAKKHPKFSDAIKKGKELCEAWYMDTGQAAMLGAVTIEGKPIRMNNGMFVWMTKNLFKWTNNIAIQDNTAQAEEPPSEDAKIRQQRLRDKIRKLNILDEP